MQIKNLACNGHGIFENGLCKCNEGWKGSGFRITENARCENIENTNINWNPTVKILQNTNRVECREE